MSLPSHLGVLEASNLIRLARAEPELEYMFRHALVQEAAYESLIKLDRRRLHRAVGEALERDYPDRLDDIAAVLAHHYSEAGERRKAVEYSRRASRRAQAGYAFDEAAHHLRNALALIGPDTHHPDRLAVLESLADVCRRIGQGARGILLYQEGLDLWRRAASTDRAVPQRLHRKILETVSEIKWTVASEDYEAAARTAQASRAELEASLSQLDTVPAHPETARLLTALTTDAWRNRVPPDWDAAQRYAEAAVRMAGRLDGPVELSATLAALGSVYFARERLRESLQAALRRLELTSGPGFDDLLERTDAVREAGSALMYVGEYREALGHLEAAEALARRIQAVDQEFGSLALQSQCWFRLDRWDKVQEVEARWRKLERRHSRERLGPVCFAVALSGSVYAQRGELDRAEAFRTEAYNIMAGVSGGPERWARNQFY